MKPILALLLIAFLLCGCVPAAVVPTPDSSKIKCREGFVPDDYYLVWIIYPDDAPWNGLEPSELENPIPFDGRVNSVKPDGVVGLPYGKLLVGVTVGPSVSYSIDGIAIKREPGSCLYGTVWYEVEAPEGALNAVRPKYAP
jgi:hypothetical protein